MTEGHSGRRRLTQQPKYTAQVVFLTTPEDAERLEAIAEALGVSKAEIGRRALEIALPRLETQVEKVKRVAIQATQEEGEPRLR
jgi:hypothetical protein